ncbi:MAG: hypothetical protein MR894_02100, partial [Akkermansia muciniphila]|nr:hypothetical protein [Akkermansia muciniphila]
RENPISDEGHNQRAVPISEATGIHLQELSRSAGSRGVVIKTDGVPKNPRNTRREAEPGEGGARLHAAEVIESEKERTAE